MLGSSCDFFLLMSDKAFRYLLNGLKKFNLHLLSILRKLFLHLISKSKKLFSILLVVGVPVTLLFWFILSEIYYYGMDDKSSVAFREAIFCGLVGVAIAFACTVKSDALRSAAYVVFPFLRNNLFENITGFVCAVVTFLIRTTALLTFLILIILFFSLITNVYWQIALGIIAVPNFIRSIPFFYTSM